MKDNNTTQLHIRNMVCPRCVMVVRDTLQEMGFEVLDVELGKAIIKAEGEIPFDKINKQLKDYGFEIIRSKNRQLVEEIKTLLIDYVQNLENSQEMPKLSEYLSEELNQNYSSLSSAFSENEDITIEKYLIHLKIERVKELLSYGELTLSEIAWKLNYSSVAHLSNQFKQITGMSVTDYKKARDTFRKPLDGI